MHMPVDELRTFNELMSKVGMFLYRWSTLEQQLNEGVVDARKRLQHNSYKVKGTFAERLDQWLKLAVELPENSDLQDLAVEVHDQAMALKDIRNLIVHGLQGGNSYPPTGEGHIRCAIGGYDNPTGDVVKYTFSQLDDFVEGAEACGRAFIRLQLFNYRVTMP